jgi:transposase
VPTATADVIVLRAAERKRLKCLARSTAMPHRLVVRARIILLAAGGATNAAIAAQLGVHVDTVRRWRHRFAAENGENAENAENGENGAECSVVEMLDDRPRPGRPRLYGPHERVRIVAAVTEQVPEADSHWSHRLLAEHLRHEVGISAAQIGRILADLDLKPHRVRGWLTRPQDPQFFTKAAAVCQLYRQPPAGAVVLSVDEKTAIAARSRTHPTAPTRPGRAARQEFEYVRHGTVSLMAALDVHTGEVLGRIIDRNDSATFISFLHEIDQAFHPDLHIYLVLDNGASHISKLTKAWLAAHPRFTVCHTPAHASWLNQIELFFSILTRRLLRRGEFTSRDDLADKIMGFIEVYDRTAKPFRWTYDGSPLKAA